MADNKLYKVAITLDGKYVHGKEYDKLVQVFYDEADGGDGCSYVSRKRNVNVRPGTDDTVWQKASDRGVQGLQGETGSDGVPAGFGTPTASVDSGVGTPSVQITSSGPNTAKVFNFAFSNLKGETGATGQTGQAGPQGPAGVTSVVVTTDGTSSSSPTAAATVTDGVLSIAFSGLKGAQGDSGYSGAAGELEVVNDDTSGGETSAWSAERGKQIRSDLSQLEAQVNNLSGKFYGVFDDDSDLPEATAVGYAFVGTAEPLALFTTDGAEWTDTEIEITGIVGPPGPQGQPGQTGERGPAGVTSVVASADNNTGTPSVEATLNNGVLTLAFHNIKGAQGNTGSSVDYPFTIVNNCTTDDATQALSAAQGVAIMTAIDQLAFNIEEKTTYPEDKTLEYVAKKIFDVSGNIGTVVDITSPTSNNSWGYILLEVSAGDYIRITGTGGNAPRLWCFLDIDKKILSHAAASVSASGLVLKAVADGYFIFHSAPTNSNKKVEIINAVSVKERINENADHIKNINSEIISLDGVVGKDAVVGPTEIANVLTIYRSIDGTNKWTAEDTASSKGYLIPIVPDTIYEFSNSSGGTGIIAFLKSTTNSYNTTPDFSTQRGYNTRFTVSNGNTVRFVSPYDASYIFVAAVVEKTNRLMAIKRVGDGIAHALSDLVNYPLSMYNRFAGYIDGDQTWNTYTDAYYILLPVKQGDFGKTVTFTAPSSKNGTFAFLNDVPGNTGAVPAFTNGGRVVVRQNTSLTTEIPYGTKYVYIYAATANLFANIQITEQEECAGDKGIVGSTEGCYSWWTYPLAITVGSIRKKLVHTWISKSGYVGLTVREQFGGKSYRTIIDNGITADDHNAPAIIGLQDGKIAAVYTGGHNEGNTLYIRISLDNSYRSFGERISITSGTRTSYAQVFYIDGTYYIFFRVNDTSWAYVSTDDFETFTSPHTLITASVQYYIRFVKIADEPNMLRILMYSNPSVNDNDIRLGYLDFDSGNVYDGEVSADNIVGTLGGSSIPNTDFTPIIPTVTGAQRLLDVAITDLSVLKIAIATNLNSNNATYKVYENGVFYELCGAGANFYTRYPGGVVFRNEKTVALSRADGGSNFIDIYHRDDDGWNFQRSVFDEPMGTAPIRNIRPLFDDSGLFFLWQRGRYNPSSYSDFDMDIISTVFMNV